MLSFDNSWVIETISIDDVKIIEVNPMIFSWYSMHFKMLHNEM